MMRIGSVCSGIAAEAVAWAQLGWKHVYFAEIAKFPSRVLAARWPGVPNLGDFTVIRNAGPIDLLVGGTPCQSFSIAGLRGGMEDDRGVLALEFLRLADRARPRWVVWENVPGVLSSGEGRDLGAFLGGLGELGYGWAYRVLDAQHFGVPQQRRRIFVVGHLGDWRPPAAVLFERTSLSWHSPPRRRSRHEVAGTVAARAGSSGARGADHETYVPCVTGQVTHALTSEGFDASEDGSGRGHPIIPVGFQASQSGVRLTGDKLGTLDANYGPRRQTGIVAPVSVAQNQRGEVVTSPVTQALARPGGKPGQGYPAVMVQSVNCPRDRGQNGIGIREGHEMYTLTNRDRHAVLAFHPTQDPISGPMSPCLDRKVAGMGIAHALTCHARKGGDPTTDNYVADGFAVRRLSPLECERLQGFPDFYTALPGAKDGPRYAALGNSMAVPVMRWLGERIHLVEQLLERSAA